MALTTKTRTRNPRRTVIQAVKAGRGLLSETFKTWNQVQRVHDENYMGGVTRGLAESERRENQPEAWAELAKTGESLMEIGQFYIDYSKAHTRRLNGEEVDLSEFDTEDDDADTEDIPLPE